MGTRPRRLCAVALCLLCTFDLKQIKAAPHIRGVRWRCARFDRKETDWDKLPFAHETARSRQREVALSGRATVVGEVGEFLDDAGRDNELDVGKSASHSLNIVPCVRAPVGEIEEDVGIQGYKLRLRRDAVINMRHALREKFFARCIVKLV